MAPSRALCGGPLAQAPRVVVQRGTTACVGARYSCHRRSTARLPNLPISMESEQRVWTLTTLAPDRQSNHRRVSGRTAHCATILVTSAPRRGPVMVDLSSSTRGRESSHPERAKSPVQLPVGDAHLSSLTAVQRALNDEIGVVVTHLHTVSTPKVRGSEDRRD